MLQFFRSLQDHLAYYWQGRFRYGGTFNFCNIGLNRYTKGGIFQLAFCSIMSDGTGHWPWMVLDVAVQFGFEMPAFHVGLFGFTVGRWRVHELNEDGSIKGPDKLKYYWMFKGINHQAKTLEEIV